MEKLMLWRRGLRGMKAATAAWMLLFASTAPCRSQDPPHDALYPKERFFQPDAIRKALAGESVTGQSSLPGGLSPDLISGMIRRAAEDPERLKALNDMIQKSAGALPLDKLNVDPNQVDPRIREFAERMANNPEIRHRLLENPEFRKLAESVQERMQAKQSGNQPSAGNNGEASLRDRIRNRASNAESRAEPPTGGDPKAAVERANRAMRKLWYGEDEPARSQAGSDRDSADLWSRMFRSRSNNAEGRRGNRFRSGFAPMPAESNRNESPDPRRPSLQPENRSDAKSNLGPDAGANPGWLPWNRRTEGAIPNGGSAPNGVGEPSAESRDWTGWFNRKTANLGNWGAKFGQRLGSLAPQLPAIRLPDVRFPEVRLPQLPNPGASSLFVGGMSAERMGSTLIFALLAVGLIALAMALGGKLQWSPSRGSSVSRLRRKPRPLDVAGQILWLFETAALKRIGDDAAVMNHRSIAESWSSSSTSGRAAEEFADLYERVRYAAGEPQDDDLDRARRLAQELSHAGTDGNPSIPRG